MKQVETVTNVSELQITPIDIANLLRTSLATVRRLMIRVAKENGIENFKYSKYMDATPILYDLIVCFSQTASSLNSRRLANELINESEMRVPGYFSVPALGNSYKRFSAFFGPQNIETAENSWVLYFLLSGDEIVYVGKSSKGSLWSRIDFHERNKVFDSYFVESKFNMPNEKDALAFEKMFISLIKPKYNKQNLNAPVADHLEDFFIELEYIKE